MHTDEELQAMLKQLMDSRGGLGAPGKEVFAFFRPRQPDRPGEFAVRGGGRWGFAVLYHREERPWLAEFCTMCHELGHARSWIQGERTAEYEAAYPVVPLSSLGDAAKQLVIEEETRAWRYGFDLALQVGFRDEQGYVGEADRALRTYYDLLSLAAPMTPFTIHPK